LNGNSKSSLGKKKYTYPKLMVYPIRMLNSEKRNCLEKLREGRRGGKNRLLRYSL
jgi:hypothetical protein